MIPKKESKESNVKHIQKNNIGKENNSNNNIIINNINQISSKNLNIIEQISNLTSSYKNK